MLKQTILDLMRVTGAFAPFRLANRSKVLILTYHRFSQTEEIDKTSAQAFRDHLEYLTAHYRILPLSQIADCIATGKTLPQSAAVITVDDGYRDFYEVAAPLLLKYRAPATMFTVTDFIDQKCWLWTDKMRYLTKHTTTDELVTTLKGRTYRFQLTDALSRHKAATKINSALKTMATEHKDEAIKRVASSLGVLLPALPPAEFEALTWDQVRELDGEGLEIGSHTATHPIMPNTTDERLMSELVESKARLESELGRSVPLFCYPNGRHDARVMQATAQAGYRCAVSTLLGMNTLHSPLLALRRIAAEPDLAHFVQSTSGFEQMKLQWRSGAKTTAAIPSAVAAMNPLSEQISHL
jgi:peptidoglycan/xylan/chitin deacetylase (PgdA/CDA1 family)